nr:MAG TPA: hypothetical protein [Caudoviricetes sp.]
MKYYKFITDTPYAGTENTFYLAFENDVSESFLEECAEEFRTQNAQDYEYLATGWCEDWESDEEMEQYYESCSCYYLEISEDDYNENT